MAGSIADYFMSLMGQNSATSGAPFSQLVSGNAPAPQTQQIAQTDNLSPLEQYLAKQRMLQMRMATKIRTADPGKTFYGLDKNAIDPNDVMRNSFEPWLRQDDI